MQTLRLNNAAGANDTDIYVMIDRIGAIDKTSVGNHTVMEIRDGMSTPPMQVLGAQDQIAGSPQFGNAYTATSSNYSIVGQLKRHQGDLAFLKAFAVTNLLDLTVLGNSSTNSDNTGIITPVRIAGVLAAPATLTFGALTTTSIVANWTSGDTDGTGYILQRATDSGFSAGLTTIYTGSLLTFTDTGLTLGTTYYYRVIATAQNFTGLYITASQATHGTLTAPATLTFGATTSSSIVANWTSGDANGVTYTLQMGTASDYSDATNIFTGTALTFTETGLTTGTTYYFRVQVAATGYGTSAYTNASQATS